MIVCTHLLDSTQAFAWFSELLAAHEELFWSLFANDMEAVLANMPPDNWDAFPLFQILNDYLRGHRVLILLHTYLPLR